jgi:hypothetical protein
MAGYPTEAPAEGVDPAVEAELDTLAARFREILETRIPEDLWRTYADACDALAERLAGSFAEVAETAEQEADRKRHRRFGFRT